MEMKDFIKKLKKEENGYYILELHNTIPFTPKMVKEMTWEEARAYMIKSVKEIFTGIVKTLEEMD